MCFGYGGFCCLPHTGRNSQVLYALAYRQFRADLLKIALLLVSYFGVYVMEYSLLKLLVETMHERLAAIDHKASQGIHKNNHYVLALNEFITAAKKLMTFF